MPTNADVTSYDLGDIYRAWGNNLGLSLTSLSTGESLAALANAAANQGAQGTAQMAPTGAIVSTINRAVISSQALAIASGTLQLQAVYLTKGTVIANVNWLSGSTAGATLDHQWAVIANSSLSVVAVSADLTSAAIAANTVITYPVAYTVPASGIYYVGVMVHNNAGTQPTFAGVAAANAASSTIPPILGGTSNTGATTPPAVAATLTALTATVNTIYLYLT